MTETTAATPNETRDTKLEIIMGREALDKLAAATVLVLGCGGVGSNCCEALARGGIGHFVILDKDIIAPSNINRQAIAFQSTIGKRKVDVMEAVWLAPWAGPTSSIPSASALPTFSIRYVTP